MYSASGLGWLTTSQVGPGLLVDATRSAISISSSSWQVSGRKMIFGPAIEVFDLIVREPERALQCRTAAREAQRPEGVGMRCTRHS